MLTVDASSNPYQIWTASLMRWARKAPSPSDEGQAQRLAMFRLDPRKKRKVLAATRMDIFFLHLFASVQKRLDEAEIASQWIHHFNVCHFGRFNSHGWSNTLMFSNLLSATHVLGVAQSTTQALANMDSYSPKHVERWS